MALEVLAIRFSCRFKPRSVHLFLQCRTLGATKFHLTQFRMEGYMSMDRSNRKWLGVIALSVVIGVLLVSMPKVQMSAATPPLSCAIFTTDITGAIVNQNQYSAKCGPSGVYLDGGPGPSAPATAAGLPDGDYYFQVTDPSGKTLLSTDAVQFRVLTVSGGLITSAFTHPTLDRKSTRLNSSHSQISYAV